MDKNMDKHKPSPRDMSHKGGQQAKSGQVMPPGQMAPPPKGTQPTHTGNK
jgi:hypothetical protein